jgi:hypothetical protein
LELAVSSMMRQLAGLVAATVMALKLAGCFGSQSYRYKLTLALNTPQGVKRASSVITDPKTVIEVDPNAPEVALGPGVSWNEFTLESTDYGLPPLLHYALFAISQGKVRHGAAS